MRLQTTKIYKLFGVFLFYEVLKMIKKYVTIKERRQVSRILAAREGLDKVNDDIIQQVGKMSDSDILLFLQQEGAEAVEILQPESVEIIKPDSVGWDPDALYNTLENIINAYLIKNNWDGEKISPLQWGAVCLCVGRWFAKNPILRGSDSIKNHYNNKDKYINVDAVGRVLPLWLDFCYKFNKAPLICNFCDFVNVSQDWLLHGVNPECIQLHKTLTQIQADGLRQRVINPKESPIGAIFLLKADHGLSETQTIKHEYLKAEITAESLPLWDDSGRLVDKNSP